MVEAGKYLRQLCARLDVSHICSVRKQQADLQLYINQPVLGQYVLLVTSCTCCLQPSALALKKGVKWGQVLSMS